MSRLAGRVTFPGAASETAQTSSTTTNSDCDKLHSAPNHRSNRNLEEIPKPRGKGNVRYQGNYSDRFQTKEESEDLERPERSEREPRQYNQNHQFDRQGQRSERPQKFDRSDRMDRYQKPQGPYRSERGSEKFDRPPRSDRSDRSPTESYHQNASRGSHRSERGSDRSPTNTSHQQKFRKSTQKMEDTMPSEELLELEDIIAQISDLNIRNDRSAAQIKRNILCSNDLIDTMDESDWEQVCQSMIATALEQGEPEFISDLMVALFKNSMFSAVMSDELTVVSSKHVIENDGKPIPALLSAIFCAHWPRQYAKSFSDINPILYTVVCIVKGWIEVVKEDTENFHKEEPKPKYQGRPDPEEDENSEKVAPEEEEKEKIIEDPALVNNCAAALSELCDTAQRQLWVNWMQVTDEIYQCIKPAITHNPNIAGDVKARLLDTFLQINQWTKTRQAGIKHAAVQTVSTSAE